MKLTASPFDPTTGELLPVYRDAYLRGDLARTQAKAVDEYLRRNTQEGTETLHRLHNMAIEGESIRPIGWVQRQLDVIRTEPERFRRRAASLALGTALVGGTVFAGSNMPKASLPFEAAPTMTEASSSLRMVAVRGRILDEEGKPLVGATVLQKGSQRGVSTNGNGEYMLFVPAGKTTLQYGYGGYTDEEVPVATTTGHVHNVTLVPQEEGQQAVTKRHRWLFF
jgi:hypothetical protein